MNLSAHISAEQSRGKEKEYIRKSIAAVEEWIEAHCYKGYEPFDGLSSFLRPLTFGSIFLERALVQMILRIPFNIRPIVGIKPNESTQGRGYIARGYLKRWKDTQDDVFKRRAIECLEWLMENKSSHYSNHSWGNYFNLTSRAHRLPKFEPTVVWTSQIGQAFLDAYDVTTDDRFLDIANKICQFILNDLPRENMAKGVCISYVTYKQLSIHNSNMLGAAMLARTAKHTRDQKALDVANEAMKYSCCCQLSDGGWNYGEESRYHWIDNFHTGYNLDSLNCYMKNTNDRSFEEYLLRGFKFYKENFFLENGMPKYYHNRLYPIDIQCAAQAIDTLADFSDGDDHTLDLACRVAEWTIKNMQDPSGYFYYRQLATKKMVRTPMMHWGQATMYHALTNLLLKI